MTVLARPPGPATADVDVPPTPPRQPLGVVSLFSGIAGLDSGLELAGAGVVEMCESWEPARRVLRAQFPHMRIARDVTDYSPTKDHNVLAAGFPCTDLSHAGSKAGIFGPQSGLVEHVFRIAATTRPEWVLLENVPHLLTLHGGAGIKEVVTQLEALGYAWAYRTVDSRFTGVPQRRFRVILLASAVHDPASRLFSEDTLSLTERQATTGPKQPAHTLAAPALVSSERPHGFYWTEGRWGIGLVENAIPTLKGGSKLGIPSAPAIWFPRAPVGRRFVLPRVEDAEQLQGFPVGWTAAAVVPGEPDPRWKLLGNAVTRGVGQWLADTLSVADDTTGSGMWDTMGPIVEGRGWPRAAMGGPGRLPTVVSSSDRPRIVPMVPLDNIVDAAAAPLLSYRATRGFLSRLDERDRRLDVRCYADLEQHMATNRPKDGVGARASWASSPASRARMQAQRQRDTKPEVAMRRALTDLGLRYQLQRRPEPDLRNRLDIVFKGPKVAVDIRGCFWHSCPEHGTKPKLNADRWSEKLRRNRERDADTVRALEERGWHVVVVWEHDDPVSKAREVATIVEHRRPRRVVRRADGTAP